MGVWTYSHYDDPACALEHGVEYPSVSLIRHFDNELFKVADSQSMDAPQIRELLVQRYLPELIVFSEEFIQPVMQEERTSMILFTKNVNRDKIKPYFKEFEEAALEEFGAR